MISAESSFQENGVVMVIEIVAGVVEVVMVAGVVVVIVRGAWW